MGKLSNEVRDVIEAALAERKTVLKAAELDAQLEGSAVDITLPGRSMPIGSEHLINRIIRECTDIFAGIGYEVEGGREIETDWYNFTALNSPKDHPSRSIQDTFYIVDRSGEVSQRTWRERCAPAHADLGHAGACHGGQGAAHLHDQSG